MTVGKVNGRQSLFIICMGCVYVCVLMHVHGRMFIMVVGFPGVMITDLNHLVWVLVLLTARPSIPLIKEYLNPCSQWNY